MKYKQQNTLPTEGYFTALWDHEGSLWVGNYRYNKNNKIECYCWQNDKWKIYNMYKNWDKCIFTKNSPINMPLYNKIKE